MKDVIVVGGGAAGIIAAWRAATLGAKVTLIEKTSRLGTKILISGGGKCNICHDGEMRDVLSAFRKNEAEFLRPSVYRFPNRNIVNLLTSRGLRVYTRPDGRIFPIDQTAKDVVAILADLLQEVGVRVLLETPVTGLRFEQGHVTGVESGRFLPCKRVVLATGGSSYPGTGTTGDGWPWARAAGHSVVRVRAALAPIYLDLTSPDEPLPPDVRSGVALRDCVLKATLSTSPNSGAKVIEKWRGDLLLTHHGVSGPCALGVSRVVAERFQEGEISLEADLAPDLTFEVLTAKLKAFVTENGRRRLLSFAEEFVPARLAPAVLHAAAIQQEAIGQGASMKTLNRLVATLKGWPLGRVRHVPLEKGEVVAGGVNLSEVDPKTMRSSKVAGLYLCGEVLDIAGPVGGYNLQAAFGTGFVAGETAALQEQNS